VAVALLVFAGIALVLLAACGGDDDEATPVPTNTPFVSSNPEDADALCDLLPEDAVREKTGYAVIDKRPFASVGTTLCTITLNVLGCGAACTVSLNDLGVPSDAAETTSEAFRASFQAVHAQAAPRYEDGVLGVGSWIATTTTLYPGYSLAYFLSGTHAYTVSGPLQHGDAVSEAQVLSLAELMVTNLGGSAP
jgi:hypothetical protein